MGPGDLHDPKYDYTETVLPLHDFLRPEEAKALGGHCVYSYHLYSSAEFEDNESANASVAITLIVACTFFVMMATFFLYDYYMTRRNSKVVNIAAKTGAILASLFPSTVRDRLLQVDSGESKKKETEQGGNRSRLKYFLQSEILMDSEKQESQDLDPYGSKPIADFFPETTVLFADIVGFTAWSSTREPTQVFTLLETIYKAFDDIAARRRVFKVETVGDCYVAVCGLPDPRTDHALVMARFARACMGTMQQLVHRLELSLGPDTADLSMRIGLHSGPVTAGVLRGERARFQLFGDTVNTASRMESMGMKGLIQVSQETADLLVAAGKGNWINPREDKIVAKGKGQLQTYWLSTGLDQHISTTFPVGLSDAAVASLTTPQAGLDKTDRLVKWNCDLLIKLLLEIECSRTAETSFAVQNQESLTADFGSSHGTVLDEVLEIIRLPNFVAKPAKQSNVQLAPNVAEQLQSYIGTIARLYRDNPFHCFEHASHVTMSVSKLMSRIIAPELPMSSGEVASGCIESTLHDHTYGITSDPLVQFACVFSALIHDVDHTGVPNMQLARENPQLAALYGGRSIAEQNSVDLAWNLLMGRGYEDLRNAIYTTPAEKARFRQLVVNSVMATDIMDKDLKELRNHRWELAFSESRAEESHKDTVDRKATIVIEHLIQASDVSHTMQHWHVYRKWNQKLYAEMYSAFVSGRADRDPVEFWYQGELGFFDFYIIPLARKLKDCGVFGVSSEEYFNYAMKNRVEWEEQGRDVVAEMVQEMKTLYPTPTQRFPYTNPKGESLTEEESGTQGEKSQENADKVGEEVMVREQALI